MDAGDAGGPTPREAVALILYGQSNPDELMVSGLHGFGGRPLQLRLSMIDRCRFRVATPDDSEEIDFSKVVAIRHVLLSDPASGLVSTFGGAEGRAHQPVPKLAIARLTGLEDAICNRQHCVGTRAFALSDPGHLAVAQEATKAFRTVCPGPTPAE